MCTQESPFYLAVNYQYTGEYWYKKQRMGKDRIGKIKSGGNSRSQGQEDKSLCTQDNGDDSIKRDSDNAAVWSP